MRGRDTLVSLWADVDRAWMRVYKNFLTRGLGTNPSWEVIYWRDYIIRKRLG